MSSFGSYAWRDRATALLFAMLMGFVLLGTGCGATSTSSQGQAAQTSKQDEANDQAEASNDAASSEVLDTGRTEGDAALNRWADECLDRRGDVTAYALSELKGGQLEALLLQQDYVWSERNQMWLKEDGSAAVAVLDAKGSPMANEDVVTLDMGSVEPDASYRLVTSGYTSAKKAFEGLASKVMTCEDVEHAQAGTVGVLTGPSGGRCLVLVTKSDNVYVLTMAGEEALKAGLLDALVGQELGKSVDEAFTTLAGRAPEVPEA